MRINRLCREFRNQARGQDRKEQHVIANQSANKKNSRERRVDARAEYRSHSNDHEVDRDNFGAQESIDANRKQQSEERTDEKARGKYAAVATRRQCGRCYDWLKQ